MFIIVFLLIDLLAVLVVINTSNARYESTAVSNTELEVALYALEEDDDYTISLNEMVPREEPYVYKFTVTNTDKNGNLSDVKLYYDLKIIATTNMHLNYKLYKNQNYLSPSANNIVKDMADLYIYACLDEATKERKLILRSLDGTVDCGSRFRYMPAEIPLDYDALVRALNEAIDKEAAEHDNKYVTEERISPAPVETKYDYDALIEEFNNFVAPFMQKNPQYYAPRIVSIVEKYLGKGKKVSDTTIDQAEFIYLILGELKEEIK